MAVCLNKSHVKIMAGFPFLYLYLNKKDITKKINKVILIIIKRYVVQRKEEYLQGTSTPKHRLQKQT